MYPKHYYETYLRYEASNQVFVAMPFAKEFEATYRQVIAPAIIQAGLSPRIINRGTQGAADIHAAIYEAILHSRLVIADMTVQSSYAGDDGVTRWQANNNVAYEVGLAAAWRNPEDILLIYRERDGHAYGFDVQNLRHVAYSFADPARAIADLKAEIGNCVSSSRFIADQSFDLLAQAITPDAAQFMHFEAGRTFPSLRFKSPKVAGLYSRHSAAIGELQSIGALVARNVFPPQDGHGVAVIYQWSELGLRLMRKWQAIDDGRLIEMRRQIASVPLERLPPPELRNFPAAEAKAAPGA